MHFIFRTHYALLLLLAAILSLQPGLLAADDDDFAELRKALAERLPDIKVTSINETPLEGIYELISSGQIYYLSGDGRFVIEGELIDLEARKNLTTERLGSLHLALINDMDEAEMLVYKGESDDPSKPNRSITVFTDVSCGYCRKLHTELDTFIESGVDVRYLLFPRAGLGTPAAQALESVWCADDPQGAMTIAKSGGKVAEKTCENPIENHMAVAEQIGLRGTPLIYLDNGVRIPGYRSANELVDILNASEPM